VSACDFFIFKIFKIKKKINCHVSIIYVKNIDLVTVFVILSQFNHNLFVNWSNFIPSKLRPNLTFISVL